MTAGCSQWLSFIEQEKRIILKHTSFTPWVLVLWVGFVIMNGIFCLSVIVVFTTIFMYVWCSSHNNMHASLTRDHVRWSDLIRNYFFVNSSDLIFCYVIAVLQFLYRSFLIGILHSMQWLYWSSHLMSYFLSTVVNTWPL